jgi:hypothetical protein
MTTRSRGRTSDSRRPSAAKGLKAVDQYLLALDDTVDVDAQRFAALECAFIQHAKHFADRRGISFSAWRDVGVPVGVLTRAGIHGAAHR